jgi:hypothetical protein
LSRADAHPVQSAEPSFEAPLVSPNNPCPFLRALVEGGHISGHVERLSKIADTVVAAGGATPSEPRLPKAKVYLIAMIANGLGLLRLTCSVRKGAQLDALRGGPLDKRGVGSRVLDAAGFIDENELARLDQFAEDKVDSSGAVERGLGIDQLRAMMDANFARAAGTRRRIDRALMQGEWPILLRVMGKPSGDGRYLSLTELRTLFVERRLPPRITRNLEKQQTHDPPSRDRDPARRSGA